MVNSFNENNNGKVNGESCNQGSLEVNNKTEDNYVEAQKKKYKTSYTSSEMDTQTGSIKTVTEISKITEKLPESYQEGDKYIDVVLNNPKNTRLLVNARPLQDTYTAGKGITITDNIVKIDENVTALKSDLSDFLTEHQDISGKADISYLYENFAEKATTLEEYGIVDAVTYSDESVADQVFTPVVLKNADGDCLMPYVESQGSSGHALFDIVKKDHILAYEESRGFAQLGTYVYKEAAAGSRYGYPDFYEKCLAEKENCEEVVTTISGTSVTTYINANGHIYYDIKDKSAFDDLYSTVGAAWYYGIDKEHERVFLPRNDWFFQNGNSTNIGEFNEAGLPNITGSVGDKDQNWQSGTGGATGAFKEVSHQANSAGGDYYSRGTGFTFDASRSSSVYGNSSTVQPKSVSLIPYMVVGNTTVTKDAVTDVIEITTTENDTVPLFFGAYFDYTPNNVSWISAGGQVNSGGVYVTAYNELVNELTVPKYGLKVIETSYMESGTDYSEYWKVNQDEEYFIAPSKLSYGAYDGAVVGNGYGLTLTNNSQTFCIAHDGDLTGTPIGATNQSFAKVGTSTSRNNTQTAKVLGIPTEAQIGDNLSKSGLISHSSSAAKLYFKVSNAVQNLELLNATKVVEMVEDMSGRVHIVETYQNGTSWYRIWSNGWCEQGGRTGTITGNTNNITLLKAFKDTNGMVYACNYRDGAQSYAPSAIFTSTSSINIGTYTDSGIYTWYACGYINQ